MKTRLVQHFVLSQKKGAFYGLFFSFIALGAFFRFFRLDFHSLWLDEFINAFDAMHPFREIHKTILASPPFFHYIVRCFYLLFGKSDFWLRFPSALFGSVTVGFLFWVVDRLFTRRAAVWAALLYAVSPMSLVYSQELRMYSLLPLLALGSVYYWELAMRTDCRRDWLLYAVFSVAGLYTHNWFLFLIASEALWSLGEWTCRKSYSYRGLLSFLILGLVYLPWLPILQEQMRKPVYGHMAVPKLINLAGAFYAFAGTRVPSGGSWVGVGRDAIPLLVIVSMALFAFGLFQDRSIIRIAAVGLFLPLISIFLVSRWGRPIYMANRYTVMCLPVYFMVVSLAFMAPISLRVERVRKFFGMCWIGCSLFVLSRYYFHYEKAPWKTMVWWMNERASPADKLNLSYLDYNGMAFGYYVPKLKPFTDWESVGNNASVFVPVRNSDISGVSQSLPKDVSVQGSKHFEGFSALVLKRHRG